MKIRVQYFGQLRHLADRDEQIVELPPNQNVTSLLQRVGELYPKPFASVVLQGQQPAAGLIILVNDQPVKHATDIPLNDGDAVTLIPPISGG